VHGGRLDLPVRGLLPGHPGLTARRARTQPRERYLFAARTVLVPRENGTYNVDRART